MGPQNALIGDDNYGTTLPETQLAPQQDISAERKMARFSKTAEFKKLKQVLEARMDHYRQFAPGTNYIGYRDLPNSERGYRSLVADIVIEEFQGLINAYEQAIQIVNEAQTSKK